MACSSTSKWDDLPEQKQHWKTSWVLDAETPFYIAAWGHDLKENPWEFTPKVPVLMVS